MRESHEDINVLYTISTTRTLILLKWTKFESQAKISFSTKTRQDGRWRRCCLGCGQWLRYVQGRFRRRRCSSCSVSLHRWPSKASGCDGWYGSERLVRRRRSSEQERYSDSQISHRTRHCNKLGWHGKGKYSWMLEISSWAVDSRWIFLILDLASHLLQRAACSSRGTPSSANRSSSQPKSQQRKNDTGKNTFLVRTLEQWHFFSELQLSFRRRGRGRLGWVYSSIVRHEGVENLL